MNDTVTETTELLAFLYACPVGLAEMTADGAIGMINPMAMQLLMPLMKTSSLNFFDIMDAYAPELRNFVDCFAGSEGPVCEDHRILIHPESTGHLEGKVFSCNVVKLDADRFMVSMNDISRQVKQERKLKEAETWFSSLLGGAHEFGVASLDFEGRIASVNDTMVRQTGYVPEDLIGQTLDILLGAKRSPGALSPEQQIALASREGWYLDETWHEQKNGTPYWCQRLIAVRDEEQKSRDRTISNYTVIFREAEHRAFDVHRLKQMLTTDHLTGTYNRMHFFEIAEQECVRSNRYDQTLCLLAVDIDHFKQVNDQHGHASGDEVLKAFAQRCLSLLRPGDTMARTGGEEFSILLPSTNLTGAMQLAVRLRGAVANMPIETSSGSLNITASFGCTEIRAGSCTLAELMETADRALYRAKRAGRNCVVSETPS